MRLSINEEQFEHEELIGKPKKFKDLNFREKINYIWDYFKWWILGTIAIIITLIITVPGILENHKEVQLYALFVNSNIQSQESTTIMDDYVEAANIDMNNKRIILDSTLYIDRDSTTTTTMENSQKLTVLFASNTIDVMISDEENFEFCCSQGAFMDLKELLPDDLYEKYSHKMMFAENPTTKEMTAYGIMMNESQILNDENAFSEVPVLSVAYTTEHKENAILFIRYLLGDL